MVLTPHKKCTARIIIVSSMHRSGSSVITRGLKVLGVDLGEHLLPSSQDNETGFWEDTDIHLLNMDMMKAINKDWHHVSLITQNDVEILRDHGFITLAVEMLHQKMIDKEVYGLKNPRMTKLLPFWREVFSQCQYDVSYVLSIRNPMSVAKSLSKRDEIHPSHSYHMWLGHVLESMRENIDHEAIIVDYDLLMASPVHELNRIAKFLNLSVDVNELEKYKSEFLNTSARHSVYELDTVDLDCPQIVHKIYAKLHKVASGEIEPNDSQLTDSRISWDAEITKLQPTLVLVDMLLARTSSGKNSYPLTHSIFRNLRTISGIRVLTGAVRNKITRLVKQLGFSR